MPLKLVGDVPKEHRELAKELRDLEKFFDELSCPLPKEERARGYVAMAHDWYRMGADEEGEKLLLKANKVCPGYFKNEINDHVKESEDFALVVSGINAELKWILLHQLKDSK